MTINANALKRARDKSRVSQEALAQIAGVSKKTIARIESGKVKPNANTTKRLAEALKVDASILAKEPKPEDFKSDLADPGYQLLGSYVGAGTVLAYQVVEHLYKIDQRTQLRMAPLFTALLAEASLKWRRDKLDALENARREMTWLSNAHLSENDSLAKVVEVESTSISARDLFGVFFDFYQIGLLPGDNPFFDFLLDFKNNFNVELVEIFNDPEAELPEYQFTDSIIHELTDGDPLAEFALARGYAKISDYPAVLIDDLPAALSDKPPSAKAEWLRSKIPPDVRARVEAVLAEKARAAAASGAANQQEQDHA